MLVSEKNKNYSEFLQIVENLINLPEVQKLENLSHHYKMTRLQHSLNVAYYSYLIARKLNWDFSSTARGGLLHDLFHYDCTTKNFGAFKHAAIHPRLALRNAKKICDLNEIEEDIILKHMWLASAVMPKYKESYLVSFVDKYCATYEALVGVVQMMKLKLAFN